MQSRTAVTLIGVMIEAVEDATTIRLTCSQFIVGTSPTIARTTEDVSLDVSRNMPLILAVEQLTAAVTAHHAAHGDMFP